MKKLLVANRGEIAVRVIRAAREMGIATVAVVSEADRNSNFGRLADESVEIGPAAASLSYLNQDAVMAAAAQTGADAVHPGYGFLSENAEFAQKVIDANLIWVGPMPETIILMGDKSRARQAAIEAGVPVLAGTNGWLDTAEDIEAIADDIGYPLVVKAAAGGGGRGIRRINKREHVRRTVEVAQSEALAAFNSSEVYFERFVTRARHVEVQVLGDGETWVHLGDRDCSMQRRQQKIIEEAPAPGIPDELRQRMRETAVELARQSKYSGAGTVEFLYDPDRQEIAFIEMNTRLQVEHPISEVITGIDLVREQLRIAAGEKLGYSQRDVHFEGHAFEFRINAEDPSNNFMPSPGLIETLDLSGGPGVRSDFGFSVGQTVMPFYDSMLGKLIVWDSNRERALSRAGRALNEVQITGIKTTVPLMRELVALKEFAEAQHHTTLLESISEKLGMTL
ncbi:acetyl-CoA carboxylase biotin carboxylase subunit [Gulosibacter molinativorax]|uniref:biotin carboxylase n=1 Tax=Gulosibacter molinativorax TaxID=256821 RepID=A0ABT7CA41_9MICO|nr:acetyl-CoA carboxylase biotin carboxylase subunit [Gulosibacter molinativorax]MDJ1372071.1 acetyl-CoA carboxylase biotin carboxylase subunit [Gulosibacter molinativorax]QUY63880.1 Acetyl-CoA carboxylase biotin carboxylase [Gulosibacter molinativorax]